MHYRPHWAFYPTPFRGWEFAIGAALALLADRLKAQLDAVLLAPVPSSAVAITKRASAGSTSPVSTTESPREADKRVHRKGVTGA